jgi:hypothetical protein
LILPLSGQDQPVSFVSRIRPSLASEVAFDRNVGKKWQSGRKSGCFRRFFRHVCAVAAQRSGD